MMNKLWLYIKGIFVKKDIQFLGVLGENNRANIYDFDEVVAKANAPIWIEKKIEDWRSFLAQYQFTSSACVAFTIAKIAQVLYFLKGANKIKFSPGWIYRNRTPKVLGMWIDNAVALAGNGLPTEELYPSEGLTEDQMNNLPSVPFGNELAKVFSISVNWVEVPLDFDTVASTIQATGKGIMLWFEFGNGEWFNLGIPLTLENSRPYRHSVCAVDTLLFQGVQYILIEDSADIKAQFGHRKLISREFFTKRCILSRYPIKFSYDVIKGGKPKYDGTTVSLQDCLKYEGSLASNIPSTGFYGNLTTEAVKKFQEKYNIQTTGNVGPVTKAKLVELFP
jgi:hypothetical protein